MTGVLHDRKILFYADSELHFPHLNHVPAAELDNDLMQLCALAQGFHPRGCCIAVDLHNGLVPLLLGFLLRIIRLREVFQFEDVTVLRLIMSHVREQEEVAIAVLQLQFGGYDIIIAETQVCHKETLDVALALDRIAH